MKFIQTLKFIIIHHKTAKHFKISPFDRNQYGPPETPSLFPSWNLLFQQVFVCLPYPSMERGSLMSLFRVKKAWSMYISDILMEEVTSRQWTYETDTCVGLLSCFLREESQTSMFQTKYVCLGRSRLFLLGASVYRGKKANSMQDSKPGITSHGCRG